MKRGKMKRIVYKVLWIVMALIFVVTITTNICRYKADCGWLSQVVYRDDIWETNR